MESCVTESFSCDVISISVCGLGRELRNNALHGPIPEALWQLTQLQFLYLYNNTLTSTISSRIGNLKKLTQL